MEMGQRFGQSLSHFLNIVNVHSNLKNPVFNKFAHGDYIAKRTWLYKGEISVLYDPSLNDISD